MLLNRYEQLEEQRQSIFKAIRALDSAMYALGDNSNPVAQKVLKELKASLKQLEEENKLLHQKRSA